MERGVVENLRGKKRHVGSSNDRIRDLCVEGRHGDKHDRVHERTENMLTDNHEQIPRRRSAGGEDRNHELRECGCAQSAYKGPAPDVHGRIRVTPLSDIISQRQLDGEINEDSQREIFLAKTLVQELQACDGVVCLESDFSN